jgi:hypothetical protein
MYRVSTAMEGEAGVDRDMKQSTSSVVMTVSVCSWPQAVKGDCSEKGNACSKNTAIYRVEAKGPGALVSRPCCDGCTHDRD